MTVKKALLCCILILFIDGAVFARPVGILEFIDRSVTEILFVLSEASGIPFTPDETVSGRTSFYYPGGTGQEALELFLNRHALHLLEEADGYVVSRIKILDEPGGTLRIDARNVMPRDLLNRLSNRQEITILFDSLPSVPQTVHMRSAAAEDIILAVLSPYPYLELEEKGVFTVFEIIRQRGGLAGQHYFSGRVEKSGDGYVVDIEKGFFRQILERFFELTDTEYCFLGKQNPLVENLYIQGRDFSECLSVIMDQGRCSYKENNGIFEIFDVREGDVLERFESRRIIPLDHRPVREVASLIPPDMLPAGGVIVDEDQNALILSGAPGRVDSLAALVEELDRRKGDWIYPLYDLGFCDAAEVENRLPENLRMVSIVPQAEPGLFAAGLPAAKRGEFEEYLGRIDRPAPCYPVNLRYIRGAELLETLPPGINQEDIEVTRDSSLVYFTGSKERLASLLDALDKIDRPIPQIRYDLLVIQYTDERQFNWDFSTANSVLGAGDQRSYLGDIGRALSLNFDITSVFGYAFALKLNTDIDHSRARVMADTTLNGLSGETVSFRNTDTYRYRDTVKDLESGSEEVTGISREITSGLFLEIAGWVSGDGMITMQVSTKVSKRGEASSEVTGILPPTTEKIVETNVRTEAGTPVVIGGLIQQEKEFTVTKPPLIGWIPLLGRLFQERQERFKNSEMVIYIIPHLDKAPKENENSLLEEYCDKYARYFQ